VKLWGLFLRIIRDCAKGVQNSVNGIIIQNNHLFGSLVIGTFATELVNML